MQINLDLSEKIGGEKNNQCFPSFTLSYMKLCIKAFVNFSLTYVKNSIPCRKKKKETLNAGHKLSQVYV